MSKRLTTYSCGFAHGAEGATETEAIKNGMYCRGEYDATAVTERLAEIEGILYDANGNEVITLDKLRAIAEAERDGRLVVLPCKVGDPIWDIRYGEARKHFACQWHVITGRPKQCFLSCEGWICGLLDFGVTVFLTREAAEAALSAGKE